MMRRIAHSSFVHHDFKTILKGDALYDLNTPVTMYEERSLSGGAGAVANPPEPTREYYLKKLIDNL
jgi:hypothetical protein